MQEIWRKVAASNIQRVLDAEGHEVYSEKDAKEHLIQERLDEISEELRMAREVEADCLCELFRERELRRARQHIGELEAERAELEGQ